MQIDILRGKEHIGGNIIMVTEGGTSILLDCGAMLPEVGHPKKEDGFDLARIGKVDAVFLSHHHGDHAGLLEKLPQAADLYTAPETVAFMDQLDRFLGRPLRTGERNVHILRDREPIELGSLQITPIAVEHSAEGAVMFIVQGGGKRLLYTGDFKTAENLHTEGIDLLITEGTMLTRDSQAYPNEAAVERVLARVMAETKGRVFVMQSSANLPRIRSVVNARNVVSFRPLMQDVFLKYALEETGHQDLAAPYAFVWVPFSEDVEKPYDRIVKRYCADQLATSYKKIAQFSRAVVFLRPTMLNTLKKLIDQGMDISKDALIFSMWRGYEKERQTAALTELFVRYGVKPQYIHTSGHADKKHILKLIRNVNPSKIACIHSEDTGRIAEIAGGIPVESGERITI